MLVLRCVSPCLYRRPSTPLAALRLLDIVHYACVAAPCQRRGLLADRGTDLRTAALVADLDRVGAGLGGDGDADGEVAVEVTAVFERRLLVDHVGHFAQAQAVFS